MEVCWAAAEPLTAMAVRARLEHAGAVGQNAVANALLSLHRTGYLTRERPHGLAWWYQPYRPLEGHLAALIAGLLQRSPDRGATLRIALAECAAGIGAEMWPDAAGVLAGADVATLRRVAAAVWGTRNALRDTAGLLERRAGELAGDHAAAALSRGQAKAYASAAEHIGEAVAVATGRWDLVIAEPEPDLRTDAPT